MSSSEILEKAEKWFEDVIAKNHISNTQKLKNANEFKVNPFLLSYLANFFEGQATPHSIAKALIYPRVMGTSINTSFGQNFQSFISTALKAYGSTTSGIDIEFTDTIDGRKKYCQVKAGPQTINKDDIITVSNHFKSIRNLARTNNLSISQDDLIVGVLYGEENQLSAHYKAIRDNHFYPVHVGQVFWHRLTGDSDFYNKLISTFQNVARKIDGREILEDTINKLASSNEVKAIMDSLK